jgi:hypothetical protein
MAQHSQQCRGAAVRAAELLHPRPVNPFLVPRAAPEEASFYDTALAWADTNTPFAAHHRRCQVWIDGGDRYLFPTDELGGSRQNWFSLPIVLGLRNATRAD